LRYLLPASTIRYFGTRKANVILELEDKRKNIASIYILYLYIQHFLSSISKPQNEIGFSRSKEMTYYDWTRDKK